MYKINLKIQELPGFYPWACWLKGFLTSIRLIYLIWNFIITTYYNTLFQKTEFQERSHPIIQKSINNFIRQYTLRLKSVSNASFHSDLLKWKPQLKAHWISVNWRLSNVCSVADLRSGNCPRSRCYINKYYHRILSEWKRLHTAQWLFCDKVAHGFIKFAVKVLFLGSTN